jgi:hypothetical protein
MFIYLICPKTIVDEVKVNSILTTVLGITVLGMIGSLNTMIERNQSYPILWFFIFPIVLYFFILIALSRSLVVNRNKGGTLDLDEFFYNQDGKYFYDYNKVMEFKDGDLISRNNISQSDRNSIQKYFLVTSIITPVLARLILLFSNAPQSDLDILIYMLMGIFYIAFIMLNIVLFFVMREERKHDPGFIVKFIKLENDLRIKMKIMPMQLVSKTDRKFLVMDLPLDNLNELTISSAYKEGMHNLDKKHRLLRSSLKFSRLVIKFPNTLKLDLIDSPVKIVELPEFKQVRSLDIIKKSSVFLACKKYELLDQMRSLIILWAQN